MAEERRDEAPTLEECIPDAPRLDVEQLLAGLEATRQKVAAWLGVTPREVNMDIRVLCDGLSLSELLSKWRPHSARNTPIPSRASEEHRNKPSQTP